MNGKKSRVLAALFLSVVLLLTIAPMVAFAQDAPVADTPTSEPATATPITPTATHQPLHPFQQIPPHPLSFHRQHQ